MRTVGYACGKIILSGNTANRFGKRALAVPLDMHITAVWDKSDDSSERLQMAWASQEEDAVWLMTVRKIMKLVEAQIGPVSGKLNIRNTLPLGKGLGSSTAIVVALARCFFGESCREEALAIEDIVNKGHSGLDFAAIWEERPIIIQNGGYHFTEVPLGLQHGFLVDTGLPAEPTSKIVQRLKDRGRGDKILMDYVETIGACTERLLSGEDPLAVFPDHYRAQVALGVVPPRVRSLIEKIESSGGAAKPARFGGTIGGAGMIFAIHPNVNVLKTIVGSTPTSLTYDPLLRHFLAVDDSLEQPSRSFKPSKVEV